MYICIYIYTHYIIYYIHNYIFSVNPLKPLHVLYMYVEVW